MKITWLGQAGLYLVVEGLHILIDPYLSDSLAQTDAAKARRIPVDRQFLSLTPDVLLCTHNHQDHMDPDTVAHYLGREKPITVMAPGAAWQALRVFGGPHNYVLLERHSAWSAGPVRFSAVYAAHSDPTAIGVVIEGEGKRLYITGDTLYNTRILEDVRPFGALDAVFLPINGAGNNMNGQDAARLCRQLSPATAVPLHWGLLDTLDGSEWEYPHKTVLTVYRPFIL